MVHKLISGKWAMNAALHEQFVQLALAGKINFDRLVEDRAIPMLYEDDDYIQDDRASIEGINNVAVIPLEGVMTRDGSWDAWGTEQVASWLLETEQDERYAAALLKINSGGGHVDGVEQLADVILQMKKPVVAYVTGMAASAAYWVASQCKAIVMESDVASEVGSIGVLATHVDASKAYEDAGYKVTIIRAKGSEGKALFNSFEGLSEELIASVQAEMEPIRARFIERVKKGRPLTKNQAIFDGAMFNGAQAVQNGMADKIGYLGDAIKLALSFTKSNSK